MGRILAVLVGLLMLGVGGLWTAQGLGWVGDVPADDQQFWATLGAAVAGLGVALTWVAGRGSR